MPNSVKSLFEINEDIIQVMLVLKLFLVEDRFTHVELLLCGSLFCHKASLLFNNDLYRLSLESA